MEQEKKRNGEKKGLGSWFTKQWQRVNLTYNFIRVPIDVLKLLLWLFIYLELAQWIEMNLFNMMMILTLSGLFMLFIGWILDRKGLFQKYQSQMDKIQNAEVSMHRWRIAGAYFQRPILLADGKDTRVVDAIIEMEKEWFFAMGIPLDMIGEPSTAELLEYLDSVEKKRERMQENGQNSSSD